MGSRLESALMNADITQRQQDLEIYFFGSSPEEEYGLIFFLVCLFVKKIDESSYEWAVSVTAETHRFFRE